MEAQTVKKSDKKYTTAVILSGLFGTMGIHHFYCERYGMGLFDLALFLFTVCFFIVGFPIAAVILLFIDIVHTVIVTYLLLVGKYKDGDGNLICYPGQKI